MMPTFWSKRIAPQAGGAEIGGLAGAVQSWLQLKSQPERRLRIVETVPLGARRSLMLLECDGKPYLAGLSADGVQTIVAAAGLFPGGEGAS